MKATLEIEMPESCQMCRFRGIITPRVGGQSSISHVPYCEILGRQYVTIDYMDIDSDRAPFCPLKPVEEGKSE